MSESAGIKDITTDDKNFMFPSEWVSPEEKLTTTWGLAYMKAIHSDWIRNQSFFLKTKQNIIIRNRQYAEGSQSEDIYKDLLLLKKNKSWINLNWEIVDIIPKYVDIMLGYFMRLSERISADAVDEDALDIVRQEKALLSAKVILKDDMDAMAKMMGQQPQTDQTQPQTLQEVQLFMQFGYKLAEEIDMEETLSLVQWMNQFQTEVKRQVILALIIDGEAGVRRYRDGHGRIKIENVDMLESIVGFSKRHDRKDMNRAGQYKYMTISEIRAATDTFTKDDYEKISTSYFGQLDNLSRDLYYKDYKFGDFPYDRVKVKVMDIEFSSTSTFRWERRTRADGKKTIHELKYKKEADKGNELVARNAEIWYKGFWIVGTDFCWNYGLADQIRGDYANPVQKGDENLSEAYSGFHFFRVAKKSLVQRMIPFADGIQLAWLKSQNALAKARPRGISMEIGALEQVPDGKGGHYTPIDLQAIYDQTGNYLWRRKDVDDPDSAQNADPVRELLGGAGTILEECMGTINNNIKLMGWVTGISEIMDASLPDPRQPVGTSEMTAKQTSNILSTWYAGWLSIEEGCMQCVGQMLADDAKNGTIHKGYMAAVGAEKMKFVSANSDLSLYNMGIRIWPNPTDAEIQFLESMIQEAINVRQQTGTGGIEIEDAFAVRELMKTSIKAAEQLLVMRKTMRKRQDQQDAQAAAQQKAQIDQQSAQSATQGQSALEQVQVQGKIAVLQAEGAETRKTNDALHKNKMEEINLQGAAKGSHILQKGEIDQTIANKKVIDQTLKK